MPIDIVFLKLEAHVVACGLPEAREIRRDPVPTGDEARDEVCAVGPGLRLTKGSAVLVCDDDRDARKDTLLIVDDAALNRRSSGLLRLRDRGNEEQTGHDDERRYTLHKRPSS